MMTTLRTRPVHRHSARTQRTWANAVKGCGDTPESAYLRGWLIRQARRYNDLLATIDSAPRACCGG